MFIYRNLTAAKGGGPQWQMGEKPKQPLKDAQGKALRFADVFAHDVTFRESAASWRRCRAQAADPTCRQGWDVHAYAVGEIVDGVPEGARVAITYDKNGCGRFIRKDTGAVITYCEYVHFAADGHSYAVGVVQ